MVVNHMAAGRYDVLRKRDSYSHSKQEYDRYRDGARVVKLTGGRDRDDRHTNGYHYSSSKNKFGGSSDSSLRGGFYVCKEDQEHGETSNGIGPDYAFASESGVEDGEITKFESGVQFPREKKRKFSPILWHREEKEVRISSKNRIVATGAPQSPPPLPKSISAVVSNDVSEGIVQSASLTVEKLHVVETSSVMSPLSSGLIGSDVYESSTTLSSSLSQVHDGVNDQEEEFVEARNISMSRWASESDSPTDTCVSEDEDMSKRKEISHQHVSASVFDRQMSSPECGEILREGSEGNGTRSSGSGDSSQFLSSAGEEEYSNDEFDENDDMEIDEHNANMAVRQLDSHSEDGEDSDLNEEPTMPTTTRSINMLQSCRDVFEYERLNKINEGTYGVVFRARDKQTGETVALKKVKMGIERDGFPLSALREMNILLSLHHPSIVNVKEVVMGDLDSVFMVMEYMEHDLKGLIEVMKQPFSISEAKCLMFQLLEGVGYLHDNWVLHRDLKSSNILMNNRGELKICDFGMSRQYGSPLKPYTSLVVTMWYRAPELLLGTKQYSTAIDMWSVGCIMAELLSKEPLFKGKSEVDQLDKIFRTLGTPNETIWPGVSKLPGSKANFVKQPYNLLRKKFPAASFTGSPVLSESGFDLLSKLLTYDPEKRITAEEALNHDWFREVPLPKSKDFMPTFPAQNEQNRHRHR